MGGPKSEPQSWEEDVTFVSVKEEPGAAFPRHRSSLGGRTGGREALLIF